MEQIAALERDGVVYRVFLDRSALDKNFAYFGRRARHKAEQTGMAAATQLLGGIVVMEAEVRGSKGA
jgi:hypothetical protein